jgi:DNA-directed RNA polymerase subunit alpha
VAQFQVDCVESTLAKDQSQYSRFVIEPLERGQGTTVGNALRRILLSNLEGTAVTAVRIAGVNHEFATIPGVREDVMEILLNMKEVSLRSYSPHRQIGRLTVPGPAVVTTGHFDLPSEVEVVHPEQYIATLSPGTTLEMEFHIEKGKGYHSVDRTRDELSVDFLKIDPVFMPIRRVNYRVDQIRVGDNLEKDRLEMEIWTNGSLTAQEAMSQAASILVSLFEPLKDISLELSKEVASYDDDPTNQIAIEELQLSVRAYNCLKRAQINTVADLLDYSQEDLLEIKNFGQKSAEEVVQGLQDKLGITLPLEKSSKRN